MDQQELFKKIEQIEEQARDALAEFPNLTRERLRMILAFARYIRTELSHGTGTSAANVDNFQSGETGGATESHA